MSGRIDGPSKVETKQISYDRLRHECQVPRFAPKIHRHQSRNDETTKNFQWNKVSGSDNNLLIDVNTFLC